MKPSLEMNNEQETKDEQVMKPHQEPPPSQTHPHPSMTPPPIHHTTPTPPAGERTRERSHSAWKTPDGTRCTTNHTDPVDCRNTGPNLRRATSQGHSERTTADLPSTQLHACTVESCKGSKLVEHNSLVHPQFRIHRKHITRRREPATVFTSRNPQPSPSGPDSLS